MLGVFERDVLGMLLDGKHPVLSVLRSQLLLCQVESREQTGSGFFTNLIVPRTCSPVSPSRLQIGDVFAEMAGLKYGADLTLFVSDGYMDFLEGTSFEEPWPASVGDYELSYSRSRSRDRSAIRLPKN